MDEIKDFLTVLGLAAKLVTRFTGLPKKVVSQDIQQIVRWVTKTGKKWTTERLKTLKVIAFHLLAGDTFPMDSYLGRKTEYKGYVIPALRIFSTLVDCIQNNNWKGVRSILDLLNIYHVFIGPSDDVKEKIDTIIQKPQESEEYDKHCHNVLAVIAEHFPFPKMSRPYDLGFKGPDIGGARYAQKPQKNSDCLSALLPSLSSIPQWIWDGNPGVKEWVMNQPFFQKIHQYEKTLFADGRTRPEPYWAGNLAILGESGMKTRIVFVGNPWIQGLLKPSLVPLQRRLLSMESDCTFDQDKGIAFLKEATCKGGSKIYSIDLTSATDNFPFFLQMFIGMLCGIPENHLQILKFAGFKLTTREDEKISSYGKGQGMGLYPSFALFALTHNILLYSLASKLKITNPLSVFRVLGDDVVITNDALAELYIHFLNIMNIPMSTKKTFVSCQFGEFAGKAIWKGKDVTPIRWRRVTEASLQVVSQYLDRGLIEINEKEQMVEFVPLCGPLVIPHIEALLSIPKDLGGFGKLTRLPMMERLAWGRRNVRSLRCGYLNMVSERITTFLTGEKLLRNIDLRKFQGMENQEIKIKEINRKAATGLNLFMVGPYLADYPKEKDIPETREGLKGLESIAFGTDSLEEQLGKYHAWRIAMLGPNPVKEFNRMITLSGKPIDLMSVPIVSSSTELRRLSRVRHLAPALLNEKFEMACERVKMLQDLKSKIKDKSDPLTIVAKDTSWWKIAGTVGATVVNPLLGIAVGIASLISESGEEQYKSLKGLEKLVP